jgi:Mrp family chromosome partitioning ATPase
MTTTNQAFIRVYRHDSAELAPAAPIIAGSDRALAAALGASIEIVAAPTGCEFAQAELPSTKATMFATSIDVLAPSADSSVAVSFPARKETAERYGAARQSQPSQRGLNQSPSEKRPLSSYIARPPAAKSAAGPYRASTTVASFRWPSVCRVLSQQYGSELDRAVEALLTSAARGRSITGILGMFPGNGCTTIALCLAARLASRGSRAVLVDGNFYSPRVATRLDVVPTSGWQEVLEDRAAVTDAIVTSVDDRLDVLALSETHLEEPLQLIALPATARSAAHLRHAYDLVLVDLGAFFDPRSQPTALELVRRMEIDSVLVVAGRPELDPRDSATIAEYVCANGCELLGIVQNRIAKPQAVGVASTEP